MAGADTGRLFWFYALGWPSKSSGDAGLAGGYEEAVLEIDMEIEEDEEEINMCRAIDEMMAEAREEGREAGMRLGEEMGRKAGIRLGEKTGREIGRKEGRENLITNMMRNFSRSGVSFEEVSSFISEEDFSRDQLRDLWEKACGKRF